MSTFLSTLHSLRYTAVDQHQNAPLELLVGLDHYRLHVD